jgi:S-adenosylmethionine-diacylglycerol 3-amino-3-carboxypropyl transferase
MAWIFIHVVVKRAEMNVKTYKELTNILVRKKPWSFQGALERLFALAFNGLVYNQIWEDPRVDIEGLRLGRDSRILTISSGGCNILNYLTVEPRSIVAVDVNASHLALTRLKLAAVAYLPNHEALFRFFGCADDELNLVNYMRYLRDRLDDQTRQFWEGGSWLRQKVAGPRIRFFTRNLYDYGSMGLFNRFIHLMTGMKRLEAREFLNACAQEEREMLYRQYCEPALNSLSARMLCKLPFLLHGLGVPPAQLERIKTEEGRDLLSVYQARIKRLLCDFSLEDNYFAWQAFSRRYDTVERRAIPDYLKADYFPALKSNVHRVQTRFCSLTAFLRTQPDRSLNRFLFLDSQDWMNADQINELWSEVARVGQPGSRIMFRTGGSEPVIERALKPELRARFAYERELSLDLFQRDRSAIYGGVHVYEMMN